MLKKELSVNITAAGQQN